MTLARKTLLIAPLLASLGQGVSAEVMCSFNVRSTINGNERLSGHGFRVREVSGVLRLEQRYADGSWEDMGTVQRFDRPGFTVFLHLPIEGPYEGRVRMLTIHQSGNGSLTIHHGSVGGGDQIKRAWLYQGECTVTP